MDTRKILIGICYGALKNLDTDPVLFKRYTNGELWISTETGFYEYDFRKMMEELRICFGEWICYPELPSEISLMKGYVFFISIPKDDLRILYDYFNRKIFIQVKPHKMRHYLNAIIQKLI